MSDVDTTSAEFFEAMYRKDADPWDYAHNEYEQNKYAATIAALAGRRYRKAFEPGCSVGVLTEMLAGLCDVVEAIDLSETAVAAARRRCAHLNNDSAREISGEASGGESSRSRALEGKGERVRVECSSLPDWLPLADFDLLVLSEIGYYFRPEEWTMLVKQMVEPLAPGTTVLGVHWLGTSKDHLMHGEQVQQILNAQPGLRLEHQQTHPGYQLARWVRE